jgi:hypothetical protein
MPVDRLEDQLREAAGQIPGEETFMARLVHQVLFIPEDVVSEDTLQYSYMIVAAIVLITLGAVPAPPFRPSQRRAAARYPGSYRQRHRVRQWHRVR